MSLASVKAFFATNAPDITVIELPDSTATVELAAKGHGVAPAQIAKTLCLKVNDRPLLVVVSGTARLDNKKAKAAFGGKPKMPEAEEVAALTGHPVGGVCPFGLANPLPVYCDLSLKAFDEGGKSGAVRVLEALGFTVQPKQRPRG